MNIDTPVSNGHHYGCHSDLGGPEPRGRTRNASMPVGNMLLTSGDGWPLRQQVMATVETAWLPMRCGHDMRRRDPSCGGCVNREDGNA
jgi:hypothetical protein